jgi:hypothetical protein
MYTAMFEKTGECSKGFFAEGLNEKQAFKGGCFMSPSKKASVVVVEC